MALSTRKHHLFRDWLTELERSYNYSVLKPGLCWLYTFIDRVFTTVINIGWMFMHMCACAMCECNEREIKARKSYVTIRQNSLSRFTMSFRDKPISYLSSTLHHQILLSLWVWNHRIQLQCKCKDCKYPTHFYKTPE